MSERDREIREIKKQMEELGKRLTALGENAKDEASDLLDSVKFKESWETVKQNTSQAIEQAKEATQEKAKEVDKYAKENPWMVAGIAALAAFMLSKMTDRDRK